MPIELTTEDRERFEASVFRIPGGCHIWLGRLHRQGYGRFSHCGQWQPAHRIAWILSGRKITQEKPCILHNCPGGDWPGCVNPDHLWDGTKADNQIDMAMKGRGRRSNLDRPFGAVLLPSGRFGAQIRANGTTTYVGSRDTAEEASALALSAKLAMITGQQEEPARLGEKPPWERRIKP